MRLLLATLLSFLLLVPLAQGQTADQIRAAQEAVRKALPGSEVDIEFSTTVQNAQGNGASIRGAGDNVAGSFNSSAPAASLSRDGPSATGGSTESEWKVTAGVVGNWRLWVGVLFLLAGLYFDLVYISPVAKAKAAATGSKPERGDHKHAAVCFVIGVALVVSAFIPGWALILMGVAAAALFAGYVWMSVSNPLALAGALTAARKAQEFGRAVVEVVEDGPVEFANEFKDRLRRTPGATAEDHNTYSAIREADYPGKKPL